MSAELLAKSEKPERKQQAASWKVFKAAEAGADAVVVKPFERTALVGRLDGLLGRQIAAG